MKKVLLVLAALLLVASLAGTATADIKPPITPIAPATTTTAP